VTYNDLRALGLTHAVEILRTLADGDRRFNELRRPAGHPSTSLEISNKTLSNTLKELARRGLVLRKERNRQRVVYEITAKGQYVLQHAEEIYDAR